MGVCSSSKADVVEENTTAETVTAVVVAVETEEETKIVDNAPYSNEYEPTATQMEATTQQILQAGGPDDEAKTEDIMDQEAYRSTTSAIPYNMYLVDEEEHISNDDDDVEAGYGVYIGGCVELSKGTRPARPKMSSEDEKKRDRERAKVEYDEARAEYTLRITPALLTRDWNGELQSIYDRNIATPQDERKRTADIKSLTEEYTEYVRIVAMVIIMGKLHPDQERLLKPTDAGGQAGGEKYKAGEVLFKFATDWKGYYGSDLEAEKAAILELKATSALINTGIRLIHSPLVSLFRYRGYCVYAIALAPVERLVYGSGDAGKHIADASAYPPIAGLMRQVADKFHLRPHRVYEGSTRTEKVLCHPVDVECHVGSDGRVYLFDLAREAPPTPPVATVKASFLTRHFRFEFLEEARQAGLPALSSDAYSNFTVSAEHAKDARDIDTAFAYLMDKVIPSLACDLDDMEDIATVDLPEVFHAVGVNMRYIPSVAKHCTSASVRRFLCEEMFVRHTKTFIRAYWNRTVECSNAWLLDKVRGLMNEVFSVREVSPAFVTHMKRKYGDIPAELKADLEAIANGEHPWSMVLRVLDGAGIEYDTTLPLTCSEDLHAHRESWKMLPVVITVKAPEFVELASREQQLNDAIALRQQAGGSIVPPLKKLLELYRVWSEEEAEVSKTRGIEVAERLLAIVETSEASQEMGWVLSDVSEFFEHFGMNDRDREVCEQSVEMFRGLVVDDRENRELQTGLSSSANSLGMVYERQGRYEEALRFYRESVELNTNMYGEKSVRVGNTLNNMAIVYKAQGDYTKALEYYEKSLRIGREALGEEHPSVGDTLGNMAIVYQAQGDYTKALEYYEKALRIKREALGEEHPSVAIELYNMGLLYKQQQEREKALACFTEAKQIWTRALPAGHEYLQRVENQLASLE